MSHSWNKNVLTAFICVVGFITVLLGFISFFEMKIREEMFALSTANIESIATKYGQRFAEVLPEESVPNNTVARFLLRSDLEDKLDLLISDDIQYAFVLFRGAEKEYRYLADGSKGSEKGYYGEKFIPSSPEYDLAYTTAQSQLILHRDKVVLGLTYIYPILTKKGVPKALLVVDMSVHTVEDINSLLKSIHDVLLFICLILFCVGGLTWYYDRKYVSTKALVNRDVLTKLYNRGVLKDLDLDLSSHVVVLLDIDFFKKVNDTYGHDIGDCVLRELARRLHDLCREKTDHVIRYGGEEFLLLLKCGEDDDMIHTVDRLRMAIAVKPFDCRSLAITASFGVDLYPHKRANLEESISCADIALYDAKNSGRNRVCVYKEKSSFVASADLRN